MVGFWRGFLEVGTGAPGVKSEENQVTPRLTRLAEKYANQSSLRPQSGAITPLEQEATSSWRACRRGWRRRGGGSGCRKGCGEWEPHTLTPSPLCPGLGLPLRFPPLSLPPSSPLLPLPPPPRRPGSAYLKRRGRAGAGGRPSRAVADAPSSGSRRRRTGDRSAEQPGQWAPRESWLEREADPPPTRASRRQEPSRGVLARADIDIRTFLSMASRDIITTRINQDELHVSARWGFLLS